MSTSSGDKVFSPAELTRYNGTNDSLPIYLAIKGVVFDVTTARDMYKPGAGYHVFAGKDASKALGMSSLKPEDCIADYSGLDAEDMDTLNKWEAHYRKKYTVVGRVSVSVNNFCLFLPPTANQSIYDSEGCCGSSWCTRKPNNCVQSTDAVVFCTNPSIAPGARQMPTNLIKSAHFVKSADGSTVQITGTLNEVWLQPGDFGGQYDFTGTGQWQVNSPPSGKMLDYAEYVSLETTSFASKLVPAHTQDVTGDYGPGFDTGVADSLPRQLSPNPQNTNTHSSLIPAPTYVKTLVPPPPSQGLDCTTCVTAPVIVVVATATTTTTTIVATTVPVVATATAASKSDGIRVGSGYGSSLVAGVLLPLLVI
ncbi:hypothetical protein SmJEL517_g02116 [Synchytrium microbalum]|uniref:Cytochrome b5 heme-binding domain-containing protein n=1 Tax=Synchytrium microbalum TaxID=1806994 RepID=A0A507C862_9FUNG|nr:uncharacterized protein SmJEL517_g02116 [Synchytrium microbalum]TPX35508.1 hypothetical protein SmJEL517_g02116 [Synchytrium microbalum]